LAAADRRLLEASAGRRCWPCAASARRRRPRPAAGPRPPSCAARCCRRSGTTCAARSRRSRWPPRASRDPSLRLPAADRLELTATIEESADRLTALVDNLLDSSRLAAGAVTPLLAPVGYDEVAVRALVGLDGAGRVTLDIDESLPTCSPTPGCWSGSWRTWSTTPYATRADAPIVLRASVYGERVELRIVDAGPGVPRRGRESLFTPFWRLEAGPQRPRRAAPAWGWGSRWRAGSPR
jgi:two-component system sensor histidine kinase KdpD